ncbi:MAG: exodeoxyribonuclease VII small subunit [Candidatus Methylomirabilota bacterium]|nr:MAG: exodeoxyribonuclease VII small subunit [candidate division NC10 bacterium]
MDTEEMPFEEALKQLEAIVFRLERGDLPLEQALSVFEEGVRLTKLCSARLTEAERRVNILTRSVESDSGELEERPFEDEGEDDLWGGNRDAG